LKDAKCSVSFPSDILRIDNSSLPEIFITAKANYSDGYNETFCLECTNGKQIMKVKDLTI